MHNMSFKWHNAYLLLCYYGFEEYNTGLVIKNGDRSFTLGDIAMTVLKTNECIIFVNRGPDSKTEVFYDLDSLK